MSALAALVHAEGRPVDPRSLARMGDALVGTGGRRSAWAGGPAGLLLAPTPFTPGERPDAAPLVGEGGRFVVAFDGRVDDRDALAAGLGLDARGTEELEDAALVLEAYEKWGDAAPARLLGSWAFVAWDSVERSLFAAASASEARTLCYASRPGLFAAATMPRGLFALPGIRRVVDETGIAGFLLDLADPSRSYFEGVSVLPPGHQLSVRGGAVAVRRFRDPVPVPPPRFARDGEYVEAFRELLGRAVSDRLRSRTPVAVSLSGGLDSSLVAATAARLLAGRGERLLAFTEVPREGFDGPVPAGRYADETPLVKAIARHHPNVDLSLVRTGGRTILDGLEACFAHREAPFRNAFNRPWIEAINEAALGRGARVVLTGLGGNATASWSGLSLFEALARRGRWGRALREARALSRVEGGPSSSAGRTLASLALLPLLPGRAAAALRGSFRALSGGGRLDWSAWSLASPGLASGPRFEELARGTSQRILDRSAMSPAASRAWLLGLGSGGSFEAGYRSLHGVDLRHPLYDVRLVEFCLAVPDEQYLREGRTRWLALRAGEGRLPVEVLANRRRGLQAADWFESLPGLRHGVRERVALFRGNDLLQRVLDIPRLERLVERWPSGGWEDPRVASEYSGALGRAMTAGSFVLWAGETARREREGG